MVGISRRLAPRREHGSMWRDLAEGYAYVHAHVWLWGTLVGAALFLLITYGPFEVLLPYIIRNDLDGDAATFGTVLACGGAGSIVAAIVLSRTGLPRRRVTFMWSAWTVGIVLDVGFAVAGAAWQMCLIASFGFGTVGMVVWNTPLSFAITGPIAELLGARTTLAVAGILGTGTAAFLFLPGMRDPERQPLTATSH